MKKSIVSAISFIFAASLVGSTTVWAADTHPQGVVEIKVKNLTGSKLKVHTGPVFGPHSVKFHLKENTLHKKLGYEQDGYYIVKYNLNGKMIPKKHWGSQVALHKMYVDKHGHRHYLHCHVVVFAGPGDALFKKYGSLCKRVDLKTSTSSGTTTYANIHFLPKK